MSSPLPDHVVRFLRANAPVGKEELQPHDLTYERAAEVWSCTFGQARRRMSKLVREGKATKEYKEIKSAGNSARIAVFTIKE